MNDSILSFDLYCSRFMYKYTAEYDFGDSSRKLWIWV